MEEHPYDDPDPVPVYILFVLAVLLFAYFAWLGTVVARLYFYKGALSPEPERFVILPAYLRDRSPQRSHQRRVTAFPILAPPRSPARDLVRATRVNIAAVNAEQLPDPEFRAFFTEQQRISRLPAFVQVNYTEHVSNLHRSQVLRMTVATALNSLISRLRPLPSKPSSRHWYHPVSTGGHRPNTNP